ncbi:MAG: sodium/hydrogen exchanger [uncultured bacterium]|uniref:Transporter, CPA2 family n=4 Tax=Candidatus Daviesiibacteriota TaxID=1752718 RepID=A0A0G0F9I7_9BACT|nr:MAG: sodium/hydrogen exchanger [uncultured bacterium]KKQ10170.1 MAG: Transporter, CPA2 family [Candidatus Daviesbacteria bacterium GW2011_GWB1_36_5]KKQ13599.1 MAG: Transporter, CPA2 family [Candidatus Daviesbacteria bacterium GW2011_GWA1_36_8]OGE17153.1 MAG: hypothetical protein A2858_00415 [Candidatus Daviesbacteria bacterium RIFCSPHIGHO2_01_FULL_36_37]OGE35934.1 MAG: hypothetical protein A3E66_01410 [Candidatus Daviesbacteria bacterium RIFCSPHIGHO2_12_FULL_37_16]
MDNIFLQLAIVLSLSSLFGYLVYRSKLPLVVAYLLAGVSLSLITFFDIKNLEVFHFLPEIGIAFVLFLIGMELDLREIKALGKPIIFASLGQIIISALAGYAIAGALGFNSIESFYLGIGLSFSSTLVVIKMLLERRDLASLYGKLSIGILLLEDLVAVALLMVISVSSSAFSFGFQQSLPLLTLFLKAIGLFLATFVLSKFVLEKLFDAVAKNGELLFLSAIAWCFVFTTLAILTGFSVEIGAFLAGVALASSPYHLSIQGKIRSLRDFFVTLFFVYLGTQAKVADIIQYWPAVVVFTFYALALKPLIYLLILGVFGFRKHTLFQTALNLSQISEFSLILLLVGSKTGLVSTSALSIMSAVAVLSIIFSSIMISYAKKLYQILAPFIVFFERKNSSHILESKLDEEMEDHVILVGAHRVGGPVVEYLQKTKIPFVVMDFNPHVVEQLAKKGLKVVYGDLGDTEILDSLSLEKAKLIISTSRDMDDNEILLDECKRRKVKAKIVARALDDSHAKALKALGADYVIMPEQVSGDFLVTQLKSHWPNISFPGLD